MTCKGELFHTKLFFTLYVEESWKMQVKLRKIGMITLLIFFPTLFLTVHIMLIAFSSDSVYVRRGVIALTQWY